MVLCENSLAPEPMVDPRLALQHGISEEEYERIVSLLGRTPSYTELGIFSVMWSEHCSYKNSLAVIRTLPTHGEMLLAKAGDENAGLVDIGGGLAIAFKIESHNHPSAVEPLQGAATGVGGILRDVFTLGARPIAVLNSLRFGDLDHSRTRYLVSHVVKGIGSYGNSFGVPTVGGEIYFDSSYRDNPLVNAMAVGILRKEKLMRAVAKGHDNPVFIVGSSTGRDGIHGATFASEEISEESDARRPSVQVGDPFAEKCLLEALLEAIENDCIIGVQDMGAAGIACSTAEMSARGGCGMEINLDLVPVREQDMSPYEIVLSESQERMLVVARPDKVDELRNIFAKWDLQAAQIGRVVNDPHVSFSKDGRTAARIRAEDLVAGHGAPVYQRETKEPLYLKRTRSFNQWRVEMPTDMEDSLLRLVSSPNLCSRRWVAEQYDSAVQTDTILAPGADAAVLRISGHDRLLAVTTDGNSRYVYLNPRRGASIAVVEAARNIICVGGRPLAITNCLNFGNPYDPEIYWQFTETVRGIREACLALGTPVTGGNVSFYNEGPEGPIYPTPVIGMVGLIEEQQIISPGLKEEGDIIVLLGPKGKSIGGSEYLKAIHGIVSGDAPALDLPTEIRLHETLHLLIRQRLVKSAHDVSDGGLAVALIESCLFDPTQALGAQIVIEESDRLDFLLYSEDQSRVLVSIGHPEWQRAELLLNASGLPYKVLGKVGGQRLTINKSINISLQHLADLFHNALKSTMALPS
jgi:phosphoribosylformylglycinamidine synthase II